MPGVTVFWVRFSGVDWVVVGGGAILLRSPSFKIAVSSATALARERAPSVVRAFAEDGTGAGEWIVDRPEIEPLDANAEWSLWPFG